MWTWCTYDGFGLPSKGPSKTDGKLGLYRNGVMHWILSKRGKRAKYFRRLQLRTIIKTDSDKRIADWLAFSMCGRKFESISKPVFHRLKIPVTLYDQAMLRIRDKARRSASHKPCQEIFTTPLTAPKWREISVALEERIRLSDQWSIDTVR